MAKAYWVAVYQSVTDPEKLAAYAKLGAPALIAAGGRVLARGEPAIVYENGVRQRTVLLEFDSVAQAMARQPGLSGRARGAWRWRGSPDSYRRRGLSG